MIDRMNTPKLRIQTGLLAGLACLLLPVASLAHGDNRVAERVISVSGNAAASVAPDLLRINFGVETQQQSSREAVAANAELVNAVIEAIRGAGVSDEQLSTTQFSVQAIYDTIPDRDTGQRSQVLVGYRVRNVLRVETPQLDRAAEILDAATGAGANRVDSVEYALAPETLKTVQDGLIEAAVLDARARAGQALAPLDHEIIGVQNISLTQVSAPVLQRFDDAPMMEMARSAPTPLFSSDQDVSVSVHVSFLIGPRP